MLAWFDKYIDLRFWNLTRVLRVGGGLAGLVAGAIYGDPFTISLCGLVFLQGIFNVGCGACTVSSLPLESMPEEASKSR